MINTWSTLGVFEGELFTSVHLTEKGALLNALEDMLMFLGIDENPEEALNRHFDGEPAPCYDLAEMYKMNRQQLSTLFNQWAEITWDNDEGYQIEIYKTPVKV